MNKYQIRLKELFTKSTLCIGHYKPSEFVKTIKHSAVFINEKPIYLSGLSYDNEAMEQVKQLSTSAPFINALRKMGMNGEISYGAINGSDIDWEQEYLSVADSKTGVFENGSGTCKLIGINLTQSLPLTTFMCINDTVAKILDPKCPKLDNGIDLSNLAKHCS